MQAVDRDAGTAPSDPVPTEIPANGLVSLLGDTLLYTAGTSARPEELVDPGRFPVYPARRGGRYTYHGPGQRVGYVLLDLGKRGRDVRAYVHALEGWVIETLGDLGLESWRAPGRVGIWTRDVDGSEAKTSFSKPNSKPSASGGRSVNVYVSCWSR